VKYWEIIAGNLSKAGWSWAVFQRWILRGEQSGLLTRIAAKGSGIVRAEELLTEFVELELAIRRGLSF
jgi:hypothetical protein